MLNSVYKSLLVGPRGGGPNAKHVRISANHKIYPAFVLHIEIPKDDVDVLVDPDKSSATLRDESKIFRCIKILLENFFEMHRSDLSKKLDKILFSASFKDMFESSDVVLGIKGTQTMPCNMDTSPRFGSISTHDFEDLYQYPKLQARKRARSAPSKSANDSSAVDFDEVFGVNSCAQVDMSVHSPRSPSDDMNDPILLDAEHGVFVKRKTYENSANIAIVSSYISGIDTSTVSPPNRFADFFASNSAFERGDNIIGNQILSASLDTNPSNVCQICRCQCRIHEDYVSPQLRRGEDYFIERSNAFQTKLNGDFCSSVNETVMGGEDSHNLPKLPVISIGPLDLRLKVSNELRLNVEMIAKMRVIGQFDNKFIVTYLNGNLFAIDQHAADERIRLELFSKALQKSVPFNESKSSEIVDGLEVFNVMNLHGGADFCIDSLGASMIKSHNELLDFWGFMTSDSQILSEPSSSDNALDLSEFCNMRLHRVPVILGEQLTIDDFLEYISLVKNGQFEFSETTKCLSKDVLKLALFQARPPAVFRILISKACTGAIKFGDELSEEACRRLIFTLSSTDLPFQCAHGRPSICPLLDVTKFLS